MVEQARKQADRGIAGRMEGHAAMDMSVTEGGSIWQRIGSPKGFTAISHYFVMDWAAVWIDIGGGLLIAGALGAWVPALQARNATNDQIRVTAEQIRHPRRSHSRVARWSDVAAVDVRSRCGFDVGDSESARSSLATMRAAPRAAIAHRSPHLESRHTIVASPLKRPTVLSSTPELLRDIPKLTADQFIVSAAPTHPRRVTPLASAREKECDRARRASVAPRLPAHASRARIASAHLPPAQPFRSGEHRLWGRPRRG